MANITLSVEDEIYKKMAKFSEADWNEFVKKCIRARIEKLCVEDSDCGNEQVWADENLLAESWLSDEDEEAFAYLQ